MSYSMQTTKVNSQNTGPDEFNRSSVDVVRAEISLSEVVGSDCVELRGQHLHLRGDLQSFSQERVIIRSPY